MSKRILCLLLAAAMVFGSGFFSEATSVNEVKKEQTETQKRLNEINKSIDKIEKKQEEIREQLSHLNEELVETMLTLELLEADIESKQAEIDIAQAEYEQYKQLEEEQYGAMKLRIQFLYEEGNTNYLMMLLSSDSITELLNRADFAKEVYDYDEEKLSEYQETRKKVEELRQRLELEQLELLEVQEAQKVYKENLDRQIAEAKSKEEGFEQELEAAKDKVKEYQETIKEQNERIKELEAEARENSGSSGGSSSGGTSSNSGYQSTGSGTGAAIANYALKFVGNPYVYGGNSLTNGIDCSGFTKEVHRYFGISIPRTSVAQSNSGKSIPISEVQPGDIIYYGNHVAIYIGNHKVVHASNEREGIKISSYTYRTPIRARRYW